MRFQSLHPLHPLRSLHPLHPLCWLLVFSALVIACSGCGSVDSDPATSAGTGGTGGATASSSDSASVASSSSTSGTGGTGGTGGQGGGGASCEGPGDPWWIRRFGDDVAQAFVHVAVDGAGNIWAAGVASDVPSGTGQPPVKLLVAKIDAAGNLLWKKIFPGTDAASFTGLAVDGSGSAVVSGAFQGTLDMAGDMLVSAGGFDGFVAKLTPSGDVAWVNAFGDAGDAQGPFDVAVGAGDDIVLGGWFNGTVDLGGGPLVAQGTDADVFLAKLSSDGQHVWSVSLGDMKDQYLDSIALDASGNVFASGLYSGTPDFGGGPLPDALYEGFLAKFDATGAHVWSKNIGVFVSDLAADAQGAVFLVGSISDVVDLGGGSKGQADTWSLLVAKLDAAGAHVSSSAFPHDDEFTGGLTGAAVDGAGNLYVTGYVTEPVDLGGGVLPPAGDKDALVAKFDPSGALLWNRRFGGDADQLAGSVTIAPTGDVVIAGPFEGTLALCRESVTSQATPDAFVAKLRP